MIANTSAAGLHAMRGQLLARHRQEIDNRLDALVFLIGVLRAELGVAQIAV